MKESIIKNKFWILCSIFLSAVILQSTKINTAENLLIESVGEIPMIGEITLFAGNFAPRGWAFCEGQILNVNSNQALHSIIGGKYGGDGTTTFALPDLRNRVPVGGSVSKSGSEEYVDVGKKIGSSTIGSPSETVMSSTNSGLYGMEETAQKSNMQPYLKIGYIIALQGTYPSRK